MKLAPILAQYLYSNHRLDLPGIGTFLLDPSAITTPENSKQRLTTLEGITFQSNPSLKESPDLIAFISSQSGKMKALANADLGSHLQLVQQFLNIGKPFTFEGIGTLTRVKQGEFQFTPASVSTDKLKEYRTKENAPVTLEESSAEYESFLTKPQATRGWRKPVIFSLIIAGIGLAIWGGYIISKKPSTPDTTGSTNVTKPKIQKPPPLTDTLHAKPTDTLKDTYKYVLEIASSRRAFERFYRLKSYQWQVQMETNDSVQYKLFLVLPALNADTTRILDSLTVMNGRKVYIEHQN